MKKLLLLLLLAVGGVAAWYILVTRKKPDVEVPQQQPVAVSQHSQGFNKAIGNVLQNYYALSESFVKWDSAAITPQAAALKQSLDSLQFDELEKEPAIHQTAVSYKDMFNNDLNTITGNAGLTQKRQAYHTVSQNLYDLLRIVKYDNAKVYLQQCPMAFNDTETGLWLSKTEEIRNPYLGLHHPKYKAGMLECGETKETLNFSGANN